MVKFIENTPLHLSSLTNQIPNPARNSMTTKDRDYKVLSILISAGKFTEYNLCASEFKWKKEGRPFFNVYPRVSDALARTSLNVVPDSIEKSIIHKLKTICIKLPIGSDIEKKYGVSWFFMSLSDGRWSQTAAKLGCTAAGLSIAWQSPVNVFSWGIETKSSFDSSCWKLPNSDESLDEVNCRYQLARIALGVMMLAADPDYIKPVLLKADEEKTTPIEERIARAKNRGVYGFTIGEEIERCPHFRRPHFAIRWTGKGAEIPKIVPVKGAVVGDKKLLTNVPTGFEDDPEIES
jgi:hypothetical protein